MVSSSRSVDIEVCAWALSSSLAAALSSAVAAVDCVIFYMFEIAWDT